MVERSLLEAKLAIPAPRPGAVSRSTLIASARQSGRPVVGVTAPAGYGKSTLLAEWAQLDDRPVAWVSLDRFDDDPAPLLSLLAAAFATISPRDQDLATAMTTSAGPVLGRAAPRLAAAISAAPTPFVLVLDDLHEVRSPDSHDVLGLVVAAIPPGSQLVTASRSEPPHLPRLRASGRAIEIGRADLALDVAAAQHIFSVAEVPIDPAGAATLIERTEGWPVGLSLAALIAKDEGGDALDLAGDDRFVAGYLYHEALAHQPEPVQRFLRRTAVVDQLSGSLCDALVGGSNGHAQLRDLEAANLFVVPLDRRRQWFRYHALFREFLLDELKRTEPDEIEDLHRRAADWYEANSSPAHAIEHLLHTDERDRCVALLTQHALRAYRTGQVSMAERWLSLVGDAAIAAHPPLAVLAGWIAALTGRPVDAARWATVADAATWDGPQLDGAASFESARSMLRSLLCASGPAAMATDAERAVALEPPWSPWRNTALVALAEATRLGGDLDRAVLLLREVVADRNVLSNAIVLADSELALVAMDAGDWDEAARHLDSAVDAMEQLGLQDYALATPTYAALARMAAHRGTDATAHLARAMRTRPSCSSAIPWLAVRLRVQLAKVHLALGDAETARHLLREIDDVLIHRPELGTLLDDVAALRTQLLGYAPLLAAAGPLSPAELRVLPYLQTHLTSREVAARLIVSNNTVRTQIASIYRKLGVSSRSEAVEQATAIGLLGG